MYRKILVITDNIDISKRFEQLISNRIYINQCFVFAISPFSSKKLFEKSLKNEVQVLDMKNSGDIANIIEKYDLVISIHCKQIFPKMLVEKIKCINVHPGYNPMNRGWYPQVFAIIDNLPIGATIHEIDEKLDHGKIIDREFVYKGFADTSKEIYNRVVAKELELLSINLPSILNKTYNSYHPENEGKVNLKKDFNKLLEFDLDEEASFKIFINRLRALTHGEFKNAYFIDPETHKKIFMRIELEKEGNGGK